MYYVYVLQSLTKNDFIYIGYTEDVFARFNKHNKKEVQSTQPYTPYDLIFYEAYKNKFDAKRREIYLKGLLPNSLFDDFARILENDNCEKKRANMRSIFVNFFRNYRKNSCERAKNGVWKQSPKNNNRQKNFKINAKKYT